MSDPPKRGDRVICRGACGVVVRVLALRLGETVTPLYVVIADDGRLLMAEEISPAPVSER